MTTNEEQQAAHPLVAVYATRSAIVRRQLLQMLWRYGYVVAAIGLVAGIFIWMATYGTLQILGVESFGTFYDAQARSLLQGRLDVPADAILNEAFINKGKTYGYFGIAPALLRVPLVLLFDLPDGSWSRLFMIGACLINLVVAYLLLQQIRQAFGIEENRRIHLIYALFVLLVGIGSTNIFMPSRSFIYHEAIMLSSCFALAYYYCLLRYLIRPKTSTLVIAAIWCFLAFLSRATAGAGALLAHALLTFSLLATAFVSQKTAPLRNITTRVGAMLGVIWEHASKRHAVIACLSFVSILIFFFAINFAKFDTFDGVPVSLYSQYLDNPERLRKTGGKQIHLENLRTGLYNYFAPGNINFNSSFPWVFMNADGRYVFPEATIDVIEPSSSIPASMPALFILSIAGIYSICATSTPIIQKLRIPFIGASAGGAVILLTVGLTQRYLHDFFPLLILTSAIGVHTVLSIEHQLLRRTLYGILIPAFLFSIYANTMFALDYQREIVWGVDPQQRAAFSLLRNRIDGLFDPSPMVILHSMDDRPPVIARLGQIWVNDNNHTSAWYDGAGWNTLRGDAPYGPRRMKVAFSAHHDPNEPLLVSGVPGRGDFVYVHYISGHSITFGFDHWGSGGPQSQPISIIPGHMYDLDINLDRLCQCVTVQFEQREILRYKVSLYATTAEQVTLGENRIGGVGPGSRFSGLLIPLDGDSSYSVSSFRVQASSYSDDYKPENVADGDVDTVWAAKGSNPTTLTITPNHAGVATSLVLIARQTVLYEGWYNVEVRMYRSGQLRSMQTFFLADAATRRIQELPLQSQETDRIELLFSQPVTTTLSGTSVTPAVVNPGYAEISVGWKSP